MNKHLAINLALRVAADKYNDPDGFDGLMGATAEEAAAIHWLVEELLQ